MKFKIISLLFCSVFFMNAWSQGDVIATASGPLTITPVQHATLVISTNERTIYLDPCGGADAFKGMRPPDLILITDFHGDHYDQKTIDLIIRSHTIVIAPKVVADKMSGIVPSRLIVMKNGDEIKQHGVMIKAIPMYNLPESDSSRHTKGRGNGYVLSIHGKNMYVSGDTDDIPEMRDLKYIDIAFVCMNPPYTMNIHKAAEAVLAFRPEIVYPYHYRGQDGLSDVAAFKSLVNKADPKIEVRLREWYPGK